MDKLAISQHRFGNIVLLGVVIGINAVAWFSFFKFGRDCALEQIYLLFLPSATLILISRGLYQMFCRVLY